MEIFSKIKDCFVDLLFPKQCFGCEKESTYLCEECKKKIELNKKFYCIICKRQTQFSEICEHCQKNYFLKAVWVVADYNSKILQDLIHGYKYKYLQEISGILADIMIRYLNENKILEIFCINKENSIFLPVPLHKKRYLNRGFNQSELLIKHLRDYLQIPAQKFLLRRKNTQSQVDLKKIERQSNVKDAFILINSDRLDKNKKVILIDDVVTTGSTLNECAKVLKQAGFKEVYGLVLAQRED
ncbi:ComF family protein [Candidatus Falkowbacteria bacterium]|nr:ComF family protein [Candidatus Falkowbacteria bacterium]